MALREAHHEQQFQPRPAAASACDVLGNRPEPSYVRVCRRVSLVDAADGDAIIEDDPVLKVGRRRGTFEISRSQRESHGLERLRGRRPEKSPGTAPAPPGLLAHPLPRNPATERHHRTVSRKL
jgi:hypothetical protein